MTNNYAVPYEASGYGQSVGSRKSNYEFKVISLKVAPAREYGYQDIPHRSFTANASQKDVNDIAETVYRYGNLNNISQCTNSTLRISTAPISSSSIAGGWNAPRYTFHLVVRCIPKGGSIIGGYTPATYDLLVSGYSEASQEFAIKTLGGNYIPNENMLFYINSVQKITLHNNGSIENINSLGVSSSGNFNQNNNNFIRPQDVVSDITLKHVADDFSSGVHNISNTADTVSVDFNRNQSIGKQWVNDTINSVISGASHASAVNSIYNDSFDSREQQILTTASTSLRNDVTDRDPFIIELRQIAFDKPDNTFSIAILKQIDINFDSNAVIYGNIIEDTKDVMSTQYTNNLMGALLPNAKVTELHNTIMSMLTSNFLSSIKLRIFNAYVPNENGFGKSLKPFFEILGGNKPEITWAYNKAIETENIFGLLLNSIKGYVTHLLDGLLSDNGNTVYDITIYANTSSDTTIKYSENGQDIGTYRFPTFADMSFTPLIGDIGTKERIVGTMDTITNTVMDALSTSGMAATEINQPHNIII